MEPSFHNGVATAHFFVKAHNFGVTFNGITAAAAIPQVYFAGSKPAALAVTYHIPAASSYDWSSYAPASLSTSGATWNEVVVPGSRGPSEITGDTLGRVVSGIDHTAQANDDTKTFIAGALLGLAGGALLSAVQEALHAND